jgi:hypothetical protein
LWHADVIREEIDSSLHFAEACCCSLQQLLYSLLLSKIAKIEIYKTMGGVSKRALQL